MNESWFAGLLDDAAVFPPGSLPLPEAVRAHVRHRAAPYAGLVGPLVLPAAALAEPAGLPALDVVITLPEGPGHLLPALARAAALPVRVRAVEVAVPAGMTPGRLFTELERACKAAGDLPVFVEIPRDARRHALIAACQGPRFRAKFRTGGLTAEMHPGEAELAETIFAAVRAGVPFKATAGLHHAVRNTDPDTGFEQHGFLNLLAAVDAALDGADERALAAVLAERDGAALADRITAAGPERARRARSRFLSFGTCSIAEPVSELADLGLVPAAYAGEGVLR
ncbi:MULTISPECIES: hypothetical protein [Thermomonospora]|uniref:Uncharacterized protein n=1 Tax=Thermomonospora cellulosilytica TaxID=1411118 RepID=A0A7W3N015_9ACTN|nr:MULTISPECIES: hypothetical protein [Thermomonospora]MBA9005035.1 hypothetical protein [Thermomonospora cellulosilytica]